MPYVLLSISIIFEVVGTTAMKLSNGFSDPLFSIITLAAYVISFSIFVIVLKNVPLGLAYGIWGGAGTVLTTVIGCIGWGEPFSLFTGLGIALVIGGIYLMSAGNQQDEEKRATRAA